MNVAENVEIKLNGSHAGIAIYSIQDHDLVSKHAWHLNKENGYAIATSNGKNFRMHRLIMNAKKGEIVDHINGNKLDNRRENLRITTITGNTQNRIKKSETSSLYIGVCKSKETGIFRSYIRVDGIKRYIISTKDEIEAAEWRDAFIIHKCPDSLFKLNFPNKVEYYKSRTYIFPEPREKKPKLQKIKSVYEDILGNFDIVRLIIPSRLEIKVIIDREDYDKVKYFLWFETSGYIGTSTHDGVNRRLSRFIISEERSDYVVDHVDGNTFNYSKANLRSITHGENSQNRTKQKGTTSKFIGISFVSEKQKWRASVHHKGKTHFIGYFADEEIAAKSRDDYIRKELPGTYYKMNFPEI